MGQMVLHFAHLWPDLQPVEVDESLSKIYKEKAEARKIETRSKEQIVTVRIINHWDSLASNVIDSPLLDVFK